jgi:imidazolonepropionase-like amidohydrolase
MKQIRIFASLALLVCALFSGRELAAQSSAGATLVKASRLLDPHTGNVLSPAAVLIENGKIKEVGSPSSVQAHAPVGAETIDLGSATLLPGLIDSHGHLLLDVILPTEAETARRPNGRFVPGQLLAIAAMSPSERVLRGAQLAREDLESGFTTVRNVGHSGIDGDTALRDAINAGSVTACFTAYFGMYARMRSFRSSESAAIGPSRTIKPVGKALLQLLHFGANVLGELQ